MTGTKAGGLKAKAKNLAKDPNFYSVIGSAGGRASTTGGFFANTKLAERAGKRGGTISRRGMTFIKEEDGVRYYQLKDSDSIAEFKMNKRTKKFERVI